jgi:hypothetical protein
MVALPILNESPRFRDLRIGHLFLQVAQIAFRLVRASHPAGGLARENHE